MLTWQRHGCNKILVLNRGLKSYDSAKPAEATIKNMRGFAGRDGQGTQARRADEGRAWAALLFFSAGAGEHK